MTKRLVNRMRVLRDKIDGNMAKRSALKRELRASRNKGVSQAFKISRKLSSLPRISSPVRYRRVCQITGRPRGTYRFFRLSRHEIMRNLRKGNLMGLRLSSW